MPCTVLYTEPAIMSEAGGGSASGGGESGGIAFTPKPDLLQALMDMGISRNAAIRVIILYTLTDCYNVKLDGSRYSLQYFTCL